MAAICTALVPSQTSHISPLHFAGYVYITGRIKEILITRGGENVAPIPIENSMLEYCKILSACMVVGDNQKYLTMLMTLRCKVRDKWKGSEETLVLVCVLNL